MFFSVDFSKQKKLHKIIIHEMLRTFSDDSVIWYGGGLIATEDRNSVVSLTFLIYVLHRASVKHFF